MSNTSLLGSFGGQGNSSLMFRNRVINGDMRIDQRNAGASINPTDGQFVVDRFAMGVSQASKLTVQQSAIAPSGFSNSVLITSSSSYAVLAGDYFGIRQGIEGFNIADLAWGTADAKPAALSFWVRSSLTGTFAGSLRNQSATRSYPFNYTINSANTWEQKTVIIPGDTTGTWITNNGQGINLWFALGTGSNVSGTAGAWAGSNFVSATGATSLVGTNGATLYLTGVQLEAETATPFERRPYSVELGMAQRYLPAHIGPGGYGAGICYASNLAGITIKLPVTARVAPTGAAISSVGHFALRAANGAGLTATNFTLSIGGIESCQVELNVASGLVQGQATMLQTGNADAKILFTGCEL